MHHLVIGAAKAGAMLVGKLEDDRWRVVTQDCCIEMVENSYMGGLYARGELIVIGALAGNSYTHCCKTLPGDINTLKIRTIVLHKNKDFKRTMYFGGAKIKDNGATIRWNQGGGDRFITVPSNNRTFTIARNDLLQIWIDNIKLDNVGESYTVCGSVTVGRFNYKWKNKIWQDNRIDWRVSIIRHIFIIVRKINQNYEVKLIEAGTEYSSGKPKGEEFIATHGMGIDAKIDSNGYIQVMMEMLE